MKHGKRQPEGRTYRIVTLLVTAQMSAALGFLLLLSPVTPARAESPPPFHNHTPEKGPIVPAPKPAVPVPAPTADIASPNKHVLPQTVATATTANARTVDMRVLVLAADGTEADLGGIRQILDYLGTPYQVFQAAPVPVSPTTDRLTPMLHSGTHGNFQAIILTTGTLGYVSGVSFVSALTTAEWAALYTYEAAFAIRQVSWYTYPNADYGFAGTPASGAATVSATFTTAGQGVFGSYANTANALAISGVFVYFAQPLDARTTTLLQDASNNALAAIRTYPDGRQNLALTFDSNQYLTHDLVLAWGLVNWATKGLFLGERHAYQLAQPDDFFIADDEWQPTMACGSTTYTATYRMNNADVQAFVNWQNAFRSHTATAQFRVEVPFNGVGATANYVPNEAAPTLVTAATTNRAQFNWMSHTWDHADLNSATADQSASEIDNNVMAATSLGLTTFSADSIVTPGVTGLTNPQFLQVAVARGIRYAVTDTSLAQYTNPSPNTGIYNAFQPGILMVPRQATNLYFNVSMPTDWLAEDNCLYPTGAFGNVTTYQQLIDRESSQLLVYLLTGNINPLMFHQANLRAYDGTHSLLSDLMDATYTKYSALFTLPIVSLTTDGIGARMASRMLYNASGISGTITFGSNGVSSVTLKAAKAATVPVTGLTLACGSCTTEAYGGQTVASVPMLAGQTLTFFANAAVASVEPHQGPMTGGMDVTIRGMGFQPGATVTFGANACTGVSVADSATIRCTVPPATTASAVDVSITAGGQTARLIGGYTYFAGPVNPLPAEKPGGQTGQSPAQLPIARPAPAQPGGTGQLPDSIPLSR
jgi:hypothetical protein